ncbi:MAG: sugar O-acetyltransferase [Clostridia bacterium]|nr:sugar O-acetyltransferase [Clostridia bacterium]
MTEREKQEAGYLYLPSGDLVEHRFKIQDMMMEYNKLLPSQVKERADFLKNVLGKVGKNVNILPPFKCDYGYHIEVGDNFFANYNFIVLDGNYVRIGDNVWIAPNVGIYAAGHPLDREERINGLEYAFPVTIGDNVWIGGSVSIIGGVTIGKDSIIGAGSVVIRDIPEGVLAAGNPCRVIRKLTPEDRDKYIHMD